MAFWHLALRLLCFVCFSGFLCFWWLFRLWLFASSAFASSSLQAFGLCGFDWLGFAAFCGLFGFGFSHALRSQFLSGRWLHGCWFLRPLATFVALAFRILSITSSSLARVFNFLERNLPNNSFPLVSCHQSCLCLCTRLGYSVWACGGVLCCM